MKAGIVSEFNPFHYGHDYLVKKIRNEYNPDTIITIMSGDYTMRGDLSVFSKWDKAKMALDSGIDLIIENPVINTVESASLYAYNAVKVLDDIGVTDIFFSTESGNLDELYKLKDIRKNPSFNERFEYYFKESGEGYSKALRLAYKDLDSTIDDSLFLPNNVLSLEYLNAIEKINSKMIPHAFKRIETGYFESLKLETNIQSATAIRELLRNGEGYEYIPYLENNLNPTFTDSIFKTVYEIIKRSSLEELKEIKGVTEGLEHKLKSLNGIRSYDELVDSLLSKRSRETKIKRILIYILLGIKKEYDNEEITSFRVLGFTKSGSSHLQSMKGLTKYDYYTNLRKDHSASVRRETAYSEIYEIMNGNYSPIPLSPLKK